MKKPATTRRLMLSRLAALGLALWVLVLKNGDGRVFSSYN